MQNTTPTKYIWCPSVERKTRDIINAELEKLKIFDISCRIFSDILKRVRHFDTTISGIGVLILQH